MSSVFRVMGKRLWQDESMPPAVDSDGAKEAYFKRFGEKFDTKDAVRQFGRGDAMTYVMPGGRYVVSGITSLSKGAVRDEVGTLPPDAALAMEWPAIVHCQECCLPCKCACRGCTIKRLDPEDAYRIAIARVTMWLRVQSKRTGDPVLAGAADDIENMMRRAT